MLKLIVPGDEHFNNQTGEFITVGDIELEMEHSLLSLSKWESKTEKCFLSGEEQTPEELLYYFNCMTLTPGDHSATISTLPEKSLLEINDYINSKQTATTFGEMPERKGRGEIISAELIYYWMVAFNIPFECENWHLNRLFALIRICNIKNTKPKKMSRHEVASRNRDLNAQRKAQLNTSG